MHNVSIVYIIVKLFTVLHSLIVQSLMHNIEWAIIYKKHKLCIGTKSNSVVLKCAKTTQPDTRMHTVFIRVKAGLIYKQGLEYAPGSATE